MRDRAGEATPADQILPASGRSYTAVELSETLELVVVMETEADTEVRLGGPRQSECLLCVSS